MLGQDLKNRAAHLHQEFPGVTPPPPHPPQRARPKLFWNRSSSGGFLISTKIVSHVSENTNKRTKFGWKVLTDWCRATFDISVQELTLFRIEHDANMRKKALTLLGLQLRTLLHQWSCSIFQYQTTTELDLLTLSK